LGWGQISSGGFGMSWITKIAKYLNNSSAICEHCRTFLRAESMINNPKHIYNPGQLLICSCRKSRIWTNSVRNLDSLLSYFRGKSNTWGEVKYTHGFCNDKFCGYTFDFLYPLKNGIKVPGYNIGFDRFGNPNVPDNQDIAINIRWEHQEGQTQNILEWYRARLSELEKFS
jgi:hypothetical protein